MWSTLNIFTTFTFPDGSVNNGAAPAVRMIIVEVPTVFLFTSPDCQQHYCGQLAVSIANFLMKCYANILSSWKGKRLLFTLVLFWNKKKKNLV